MSALTEVTISCPHCRRQYPMKIDPERMQRLKTRATCGRCGKTFDATSRIIAAQQEQNQASSPPPDEPKPTPVAELKPRPPSSLKPTLKSSGVTAPDMSDEMEELAREFAEAASRFTPVGVKRSSIGLGPALSVEPAPAPKPAAVEEPTNPGIVPASVAAAKIAAAKIAAAIIAPSVSDEAWAEAVRAAAVEATAADQLAFDAEPAGEEEFASAVPTLSRLPALQRSWLDECDPGLAALESPPAPGAAALEALFNEAETIALPPPPAAS